MEDFVRTVRIQKFSNQSLGVIIPSKIVKLLALAPQQEIRAWVDGNRIIYEVAKA